MDRFFPGQRISDPARGEIEFAERGTVGQIVRGDPQAVPADTAPDHRELSLGRHIAARAPHQMRPGAFDGRRVVAEPVRVGRDHQLDAVLPEER